MLREVDVNTIMLVRTSIREKSTSMEILANHRAISISCSIDAVVGDTNYVVFAVALRAGHTGVRETDKQTQVTLLFEAIVPAFPPFVHQPLEEDSPLSRVRQRAVSRS